jgi:hypothetical protein
MLSSFPRFHCCRRPLYQSAIALMAFGTLTRAAVSQILTPAITFQGPRNTAVPITPAEAVVNLGFEGQRTASDAVRMTQTHYPKDSLLALDTQRAQVWVVSLPKMMLKGMQLDPYGELAVTAKQDKLAERQIALRLANAGLSLAERAYTLAMAAQAFASAETPERLPVAERYIAQLDALGAAAAYWRFRARGPLVSAYYRLGFTADVARHGTQALRLLGDIPYVYRDVFYGPNAGFLYGSTVDALSGQPDGRATLRALNTQLLQWAMPPAELVALDSMYVWQGKRWKGDMEHLAAMSERIGQPGTALVSNYWVNRGASRDSQTVAVNDNKIRVLEIGSFTCAPCMAAVSGLERLHQQYPEVEFNFLTSTIGTWGNRIVEPKVEADRIAEHFLTMKKITFPIGIALSPRVPTEDGGAETVVTMPTWRTDQYPQIDKPTFYVLDGKGIIRRVIAGYDRGLEKTLGTIVEFLQKETLQDRQQGGTKAAVSVR